MSFACDFCDGLEKPNYRRGYIVLRPSDALGTSQFYVFKSRRDAAVWRTAQDLAECPIREVSTEAEIRWRPSSGSIKDIEFADRLFTIFADWRYAPAHDRGFLTPPSSKEAAA